MFTVAKAKRQQQFFSVRKRSDSNKCFICAKAKRQQQLRRGAIDCKLLE
ncbi:hypothetical protein [Lysinibacillus sp. Bpr_S20]|nr:hypothetical protein [Lysinibacillus sp. Bpr_S20]MCL1699924.1 hypothetical protein [Lysinibacillus sp. Bpr_S20]